MALSSASPQIANVKDGEKSPPGDLEEGEIEDGELPDEEGETEIANIKSKDEHPHGSVVRSVVKVDKSSDKHEKSNDTSLSRLNRRKNHNSERNNDQEEEWACVVEKQLKAAMSKDSGNENFNGTADAVISEKTFVDEDKRSRRKKRKKKHKDDDDDDKKESKKRKKSHHWGGEEGQETSNKDKARDGEDGEEDDDEMLFVRGASPVAREGFGRSESPSSKFVEKGFSFNQQGGFEETYDSYNEEESDFESREEFSRCNPSLSDDEAPKRGLGRGAKRRQRTVGRPLPHNKRQARKDTKSKRGGLKRQQSSRSNSEREPNVCMFYMQGKCQKGEECPYSHNACPPKKMELCKFYLMDCCAKKDKCLYMHHDFPCKFFHTGLKCFSGPRCKFSHGQLSEAMRSILLKGTEGNRHNELRLSNRPTVPSQEHRSKHLETAPKELLGDFPRLSREGAAAMVYNKKNRTSKAKKIPSLLDIEIPIPAQLLADQKEGTKDQSPRRTPMPESDNEDQDGTTTPMPLSPVNDGKSKNKNRWGSDDLHGSLSRDSKDDNLFREDEEDGKPLLPKFYQETDSEGGNKSKSEVDHGMINLHRFAGYSPNHADDKKTLDLSSTDKTGSEEKELKKKTDDKTSQRDSANGDSGTESNDATNIPLHLPKKQRELFLRIQQQQREAESSQDRSGDHDDEIDAVQEENWYSSDDEEDSLTNVLKNLSKQGTPTTSHVETSSCPAKEIQAEQKTSAPALPMKIPDLSKIKIDESFTKLLSSICGKKASEESSGVATNIIEQPTPQTANASVARDPRLSRDPRSRSHSSAATAASGTSGSGLETAATSSSTTTTTTHSSSYDSSRRTDPRRVLDPRSAKASQKNEDHKHSSSSSRRSGSHTSSFPSIYSNAIMGEKTSSLSGGLGLSGTSSGDIDLRNFLPRTLETGDVDLRSRGDTDLRTGQPPTTLVFGDTDLRVRSHELMNVGQMDSGRNNSDVDLRRLELPFKPVPMHTPATEIEASLTSHPPIPYKVVVVTIPRPDYSSLKLNTSDPQVQSDPRLRKIFKLQSPGLDNTSKTTLGSGSISSVSRSDPRRQSSRSSNSSSGGSGSGSISNINNNVSGGTSNNTLVSNEHHEHSSEPFGGSPVLNIASKTLSDKPNSNTLLLQSGGLRSGLISPASSPLLPNPSPRVGRDPRCAPGLLGPAPLPANYCPNTPLFEEHIEMGCGMDNDPRVMFNRGSVDGARWEQHSQGSPHVTRNNWRSNRRNPQSRYSEDPRSYTPPI